MHDLVLEVADQIFCLLLGEINGVVVAQVMLLASLEVRAQIRKQPFLLTSESAVGVFDSFVYEFGFVYFDRTLPCCGGEPADSSSKLTFVAPTELKLAELASSP